jgi:N-acetylglutamate synthase-like GNAT family acetyltransferase
VIASHFVSVRIAETRDGSSVQTLLNEAIEEQKKYRGQFSQTHTADKTLVAVVGESVVGILQYVVNSKDSAVITCVHVHHLARDIGVGDSLLLRAVTDLQNTGVEWLSGQAQPGDRALKNLFERHGLVAQTIVVGKSLSDPSTAVRASQ